MGACQLAFDFFSPAISPFKHRIPFSAELLVLILINLCPNMTVMLLRDALDFLPAVKDWMAEAATRPGISGRRDGARLNEGGLWPTAPLVRRGLGQRELAAAAAHRPPQAAGRRHCVRHAHRSGPAPAGPHSGCGTWDRSAQPPAPSGRQRCATGPGQRSA